MTTLTQSPPPPAAGVGVGAQQARAFVFETACNCHPETCAHGEYMLAIDGETVADGSEQRMRKIADAVNRAAQQEAEPVAWRYQYKNTPLWQFSVYEVHNKPPFDYYWVIEPLYTAPQPHIDLSQLKELEAKWRSRDECTADRYADELSAAMAKARHIDLSQFKPMVEMWKAWAGIGEIADKFGPFKMKRTPEEYAERVAEADRLLAMIAEQ